MAASPDPTPTTAEHGAEELRALLERSTPGPWIVDPEDIEISVEGEDDFGNVVTGWKVIGSPEYRLAIAVCDMGPPNCFDDEELDANAALIVAAVNALPGLLDTLSSHAADKAALEANYQAAVKGRKDFRQAYHDLLPIQRAAQALSDHWRTGGARVDSEAFFDLVNAVDVAVTGGGPTTPVMREQIAARTLLTKEPRHG